MDKKQQPKVRPISGAIKTNRVKAGMTISKLAELSGLSRGLINSLERGNPVKAVKAKEIVDALNKVNASLDMKGVNIEDFFEIETEVIKVVWNESSFPDKRVAEFLDLIADSAGVKIEIVKVQPIPPNPFEKRNSA